MKTKVCSKCGAEKSVSEFSKNSHNKEGLRVSCKDCDIKQTNKYYRTKNGLIARIYSSQRSNSKLRKHPLPPYSLIDLKDFLLSQPLFNKLYNEWVLSDYNVWEKPSCDRTDDYQGYSLDRINIVTWKENNDKGNNDRKKGVNNKGSRAVIGINIKTGKTTHYYSISEASRKTGIHLSGIVLVCQKKQKYAGNYYWKYI